MVRTVTDAHANNPNVVVSRYSAEASAVAWPQINVQISGTVLAGGSPLRGRCHGRSSGSVVTNASGVYDATVAAGWSGTVIPTLDGYTFDPVSTPYTSVMEDQTSAGLYGIGDRGADDHGPLSQRRRSLGRGLGS